MLLDKANKTEALIDVAAALFRNHKNLSRQNKQICCSGRQAKVSMETEEHQSLTVISLAKGMLSSIRTTHLWRRDWIEFKEEIVLLCLPYIRYQF